MRQLALFCVALFATSTLCFAATHHKSAKKSTKTTASSRSKSARNTKSHAQSRYHGPQAPSPERYREIQQKLAAKGFFHGSADGVWGADSVDALKRFQKDQGLDPDGKLGSLSLIALGLGPKRLTAQSGEAPASSTAPPAGAQK